MEITSRAVIIGFSGGVTSAWCAGWALRNFPREQVTLLHHDTKEEHPDTYRFIREMSAALDHPVVEQSDGRSVTQLFLDEGFLGNNQNTMCSRILKAQLGDAFIDGLRMIDVDIHVIKVVGYSATESKRVMRMVGRCAAMGIEARFPVIEERVTKQQCADWCRALGVRPSAMYEWADHANCIGCVKGGREYWLAVAKHHPEVFEQRAQLEEQFGHSIIRGDNPIMLRDLLRVGLKRKVSRRERIEIGACECGD